MRKIAILTTVVLAALAASAPASGAVLLAKRCTTSCTSFQANGKGWVSVVGSGAEYGSLSSGTVWVRDRTGQHNPRYDGWVHGSGLTWKWIGDDGWKVTSKHPMTVNGTGKFWVKLQGPGIQVCGVFDGSGAIQGDGSYAFNGGKSHSWPDRATDLHF
jgi:hypothetical protein